MNKEQLDQLKEELKISNDKIIREEAEMIFLEELAKDKISSRLVFYGGTALRLVYDSPRFSEDIDLIKIESLNFSDFKKFVSGVAVKYNWKLSDLKDKRQTMFALLNIKDENLKHPFSLKIEIHKPSKKVKLESKLEIIKSPVSILAPLLLVATLAELKKMKEAALADRQKARDLFDLWYISRKLRNNFVLPENTPKFKERDFKNELQVFLPLNYYPIIKQLYEQINQRNNKTS